MLGAKQTRLHSIYYSSIIGLLCCSWPAIQLGRHSGAGRPSRANYILCAPAPVQVCGAAAGPPISWADTAVLGAKVAAEKSFVAAKISRAGNMTDGETISKAFGADWPVRQPCGAAPSASLAGTRKGWHASTGL